MRIICPECKSHDINVTETEVICNICNATVDFKIDGTWVFDASPCDVAAELKMYNVQYHRYVRTGYHHEKVV